jgi:hypothetical protein
MVASTHPQERVQIRRMADASLALAERRAGDLKTAVEKLGQEAPSARALFGLRVMGLIAPPRSLGMLARLRGIAIAIVAVIALIAIGTGIVELISLPSGRLSLPPAILLGVILDGVVIAVLAAVGRRRLKAARARPAGGSGRERTRMAAKRTHHKHSSSKGYRRVLDRLADHPAVHRVATGRVTPRMGAGRPVALISKVRPVASGLSITINVEGAVIDAYVITDQPDAVAAFMREQGWTAS